MRISRGFWLSLLLVLIVVVSAGWALFWVDKVERRQVGHILEAVLETSAEGARHWADRLKSNLAGLAGSERLRSLVEAQLALPRQRAVLAASPALEEIRGLVRPILKELGFEGLSVVALDGIVVATTHQAGLGQPHFLAGQGDCLDQVFSGQAIMTAPLQPGGLVEAEDEMGHGDSAQAGMFVAGPILDKAGRVMAVLAACIDPAENFNLITQQGRVGLTGETYAFDERGFLITESRFDETLHRIGLIEPGQQGAFSIEIRDPGGDMTRGFRPAIPRDDQPLTRMAAEATAGRSGVDTDGYRGYRGVTVVGAWLWDDELGFGLAVEQDEAEALQTLRAIRLIVLSLVALIGAVFVGVAFILARGRRKALALAEDLTAAVARQEIEMAERKEADEALLESEEQVRLLLDSTAEAIYGLDLNGECTFANPACVEILGYQTVGDLLGQNMHELIHHTRPDGTPYPAEECRIYQAFIQGEGAHVDDEVLWRADGTSFWAEYWSYPTRQNGETIGSVVTFLDITERKEVERALRESEERLRKFQDAATDGFVLLDSRLNILDLNAAIERIMGMPRGDVIGKNVTAISPTLKETGRYDQYMEVIETGEPLSLDDLVPHPKFGDIHLNVKAFKVGDGLGIITTDITERKKAEEALRESEERFSTIFRSSPVGMSLTTLADGKCIDINESFAGITGYSREEALGRTSVELGFWIEPGDRDEVTQSLKKHGSARDMEFKFRTKAGEIRSGDFSLEIANIQGEPCIITTMRDVTEERQTQEELEKYRARLEEMVAERTKELASANEQLTQEATERQEAEEALRKSEQQLDAIIENSTASIYLKDVQGRYLLMNQRGAHLLRMDREDIIGRTDFDIFPPEMAEKFSANDRRVLESGVPLEIEEEAWLEDGVQYYLSVKFPLRNPAGAVYAVCGISTEITERKQAEDNLRRSEQELRESLEMLQKAQAHLIQSEKAAALGGLVAGVAHEISTPVGIGVTAASHLEEKTRELNELYRQDRVKRSDLDGYLDVASQTSEMILSNLVRAAELIQSFKQVAVDQSGEEWRSFKLKKYLGDVLLSLAPEYKRTSHTIELNCPDDLAIKSYPGAFSQIVTNLVINSLTHGFEGIEVGRVVMDVSREGNDLLLNYRDNGKGMDKETVAKIFDPFFTTSRAKGGSGLGMHIVYNLVTHTLGGRIEVSSQPGEGAAFLITLPLNEENGDAKHG